MGARLLLQDNLKDNIIRVISSNSPISLKQLYSYLRSQYQIKVTYQAVHKAVNELLDRKILERNTEKKYELSVDWIKQVKQFTNQLEQAYLKHNLPVDNYSTVKLNSLWELYQFILYNGFVEDKFNIGNQSICIQSEHVWLSPLGTEKELTLLKQSLKNRKVYVLVRTNTPLDRMQKRAWENLGLQYKLGKVTETGIIMMDTFVFGEFVLQIYFPNDFSAMEDIIYSETKKIENIKIEAIQELFHKPCEIQVVIQKNKIVAERLRERTEREFR